MSKLLVGTNNEVSGAQGKHRGVSLELRRRPQIGTQTVHDLKQLYQLFLI